jgi:hypothetical protein
VLHVDWPKREKRSDRFALPKTYYSNCGTGNSILLPGPGKDKGRGLMYNQEYLEGGAREREVEGGSGVTLEDEYFVGG